jgi:hypothetical protein
MIDKNIAEIAVTPGSQVDALTLKDFLDAGDNKLWIDSFGCLIPDDTLKSAKAKMDGNPKCQDVIVTEGDSADKPAQGWITDVIVLEKSRA